MCEEIQIDNQIILNDVGEICHVRLAQQSAAELFCVDLETWRANRNDTSESAHHHIQQPLRT